MHNSFTALRLLFISLVIVFSLEPRGVEKRDASGLQHIQRFFFHDVERNLYACSLLPQIEQSYPDFLPDLFDNFVNLFWYFTCQILGALLVSFDSGLF
jgi:hypothetical protein